MVSAMAAHFFVPYSPTRLRSCWSSASVHTKGAVVRPVGAPGGFEAAADAAADADAACFAFPFLVLAAAPAPAPAPVLPAGGGGGALPVAPGGGFGGGRAGDKADGIPYIYVRTLKALTLTFRQLLLRNKWEGADTCIPFTFRGMTHQKQVAETKQQS